MFAGSWVWHPEPCAQALRHCTLPPKFPAQQGKRGDPKMLIGGWGGVGMEHLTTVQISERTRVPNRRQAWGHTPVQQNLEGRGRRDIGPLKLAWSTE